MKTALGLILVSLLFGVLGLSSCAPKATIAPPPQSPLPPKPEPRPASFSLSSLNITPAEALTGSSVNITVLVSNDGELSGIYEVILKIDGAVEATENVTLPGGASQNVTFTMSRPLARTYAVGIGELSGTLVVKGPPASPFVKVALGYKTSRVSYPSLTYGYSIFHPVQWTADTSNRAQLQFKTESGAAPGLLSITSTNVTYTSLDDFVNFSLSFQERRWKEKGATMTIVSRGTISLPMSRGTFSLREKVAAADIVLEIEPGGGKARHIYALVDNQAFMIVAETYAQFWDVLSPSFDRAIISFTVSK